MLQGNWQPPSHSFYHVHVFSDIELWCFSFVTLFNLQGTRSVPCSVRNIHYLTTGLPVCQVLFSTFFKVFFVPDSPSGLSLESLTILPQLPAFVKPFFRFSRNLFLKLPSQPRPSATARLIYQIPHTLSIPFSIFFEIFFLKYQRHFLTFVI